MNSLMSNNPALLPEWSTLATHAQKMSNFLIRDMFRTNPNRFDEYSLSFNGLFLDYSKNNLNAETLKLLMALARQQNIESARDRMFSGDPMNTTESRPVLHTALRAPVNPPVMVGSENIMLFVHDILKKIESFCRDIHQGIHTGHTGKRITHIVNLGTGGSYLGPQLAVEALSTFKVPRIKTFFVSNVDGADIDRVLKIAPPEQTLFIVASKTFTTRETITNAHTAKKWLVETLGHSVDVSKHFIALSTNDEAAQAFGIRPDLIFPFRDWVGGRFSLWSSIGMSIALSIGFDNFQKLLNGAHDMDQHFCSAPLEKNMPILLAVIGIWNRNFLHRQTQAIIPYNARLARFPYFLQQLDMESNGKSVDLDGGKITAYDTGSIIFGEPGTDSQHSFFQKIHQGTDIIPVDFIGVKKPDHPYTDHHTILMHNMVAQSQALMEGRPDISEGQNPHRYFSGNRPSNTLILDELSPYHLGLLIALYEHKIFVQGVIWHINSFDQFGVELGKELAKNIEKGDALHADSSTRGLLHHLFT
ncbi:MAG: glucose-6-phosphate isomerase [Alphaproteobacteria bacterium]|nr:glucose-6-phosphate isomerase [Alphaproteobacteria bacterium]